MVEESQRYTENGGAVESEGEGLRRWGLGDLHHTDDEERANYFISLWRIMQVKKNGVRDIRGCDRRQSRQARYAP